MFFVPIRDYAYNSFEIKNRVTDMDRVTNLRIKQRVI